MSTQEKTLNALSNLVVNCPELTEVERLLGRFNLFRILKFEEGEIRHSNVLAWLLDPKESHGLGDLFLRRFLMLGLNDSEGGLHDLDPVELDSAEIRSVEVLREWNHIDVTIRIQTVDENWVVAIENKVRSKQHSNQLTKYRKVIEASFPEDKKLFIFLCKNREEPEDDAYIEATYDQVHAALSRTFDEQSNSIGDGPRTLIQNYLSLLEEKFMENSRIAELAAKIYKSHKLALDVIFEHRPSDRVSIMEMLEQKLLEYEGAYKLIPMPTTRSYFRFLIDLWDVPKNRAGMAWGDGGAYVLLEIPLGSRNATFKVMCGKTPHEWMEKAWNRSKTAPFEKVFRKTAKMPSAWLTIYSQRSKIKISDLDPDTAHDVANEVWAWVEKQLNSQSFRNSAQVIVEMLEDLPDVSNTKEMV
jgi:hypothetical protein